MGKKKILLDTINQGKKAVTDKLQFIHNTSPEKLKRIESMGGMPMPSIAVTKENIPFEGFGDISLIGKPQSFDPKASARNKLYSADAYTARAPRPVKVARKGAGKRFDEGLAKELEEFDVYTSETSSNIWQMEGKRGADESQYNQVAYFLEKQSAPLYLKEKGIPFNDKWDAERIVREMDDKADYNSWVQSKIDDVFEPEEYFISNPDRDRYTQNPQLKPYNAEEITKYMKKQGGIGAEGGLASNSAGGVRASTAEKIPSLPAAKKRQESLVSAEDMAEFKQTSEMMLDDLQEAFKPYYKYESDSWHYGGEFRDFVKDSEKMGVQRAAREYGFEPTDELIQELNDYKDMLRGGPTEYFESKPERVVEMTEFGGAVAPIDTPKETLDFLESQGVPVELYDPKVEGSRVAARNKFKEFAFSKGAGITTTGALASLGLSGLSPQRAQAEEQAKQDYLAQSQAIEASKRGIGGNLLAAGQDAVSLAGGGDVARAASTLYHLPQGDIEGLIETEKAISEFEEPQTAGTEALYSGIASALSPIVQVSYPHYQDRMSGIQDFVSDEDAYLNPELYAAKKLASEGFGGIGSALISPFEGALGISP